MNKIDYGKQNLPRETIINYQNEIGKSMSPLFGPKDTFSVPGFAGKYKQNTELTIQQTDTPNNTILSIIRNSNPRRRHPFGRPRMRGRGITVDPPQNIQGLGNIPEAPKVRSFTEVDTGLNARRGNHGDQCPASQFNMEKEYTMFMEDMSQKGIEVECDQQRFNDLSVNQETGAIDEKSIFEAKGGLQGEGQKMYKNLRRPANPDVRLDFEATDIKTGKRIFVDHKGMIDFQSLADQGKDISRFPSHETVAYRMGQDIPSQKERFIGLPQGPKSANEVLHLVNFNKIRNSLEKPSLVSAVLNGAEDAGCGDNIAFINFE